jgi:hypothetical protein
LNGQKNISGLVVKIPEQRVGIGHVQQGIVGVMMIDILLGDEDVLDEDCRGNGLSLQHVQREPY